MQNHPISLPPPMIPWVFRGALAFLFCLAEAVGHKGGRVKKRARCCLCLDRAALKTDSRVRSSMFIEGSLLVGDFTAFIELGTADQLC